MSTALLALTDQQGVTFWVELAVLCASGLLLGAAARRLGQPAVLGELAAGILLGPTVLGALAPDLHDWLFPGDDEIKLLLSAVGMLGVFLLLLGAGLETDLAVVGRHRRAAAGLAAATLLLPLGAGALLGAQLPDRFLVGGADRGPTALFVGAALAVSALPVAARILDDLGLLARPFAQITLAVAMVDTIVAWVLMGIAAGVVATGQVDGTSLVITIVGVAAMLALTIGPGGALAARLLARVAPRGEVAPSLGALVVLALGAAATMGALHVEPALGAFLAGIIVRRSGALPAAAGEQVMGIVRGLLAPVFFASAGLQVDLGALGDGTVLLWATLLITAGSIGKLGGALLGGRLAGLDVRTSAAVGAGLSARGALGIIVATVGVRAGVVSADGFTLLVLFAVVTTLTAPPLLRALAPSTDAPT